MMIKTIIDLIVNYYKILCGLIALGLAIYNFYKRNHFIGCYWLAVVMYWTFNFIGGIM